MDWHIGLRLLAEAKSSFYSPQPPYGLWDKNTHPVNTGGNIYGVTSALYIQCYLNFTQCSAPQEAAVITSKVMHTSFPYYKELYDQLIYCQLQEGIYSTKTVNQYSITIKEQYLLYRDIHINVILTVNIARFFRFQLSDKVKSSLCLIRLHATKTGVQVWLHVLFTSANT